MKTTIRAAAVAAAAVAAMMLPDAASAQSWPSKPIRFFQGFAPGGATDIVARLIAPRLSEALGQPIVVENKVGAGGTLASDTIAKADPDGHTMVLLVGGHAVSGALYKTLPYHPVDDFAMAGLVATMAMVFVSSPENAAFTATTLKDVVAQAKASPRSIRYASVGIGSSQHFATEVLRATAGIDIVHVPYRATPAAISALRAREIQMVTETLAPVLGQIKGGQLRALAVTSAQRFPGLPDVPTTAESGVPGFNVTTWYGVAFPAKTPPAIISRMNAEIHKTIALPDIQQRFIELGIVARGSTPDEMRTHVASEIAKWQGIMKTAGIEQQ